MRTQRKQHASNAGRRWDVDTYITPYDMQMLLWSPPPWIQQPTIEHTNVTMVAMAYRDAWNERFYTSAKGH